MITRIHLAFYTCILLLAACKSSYTLQLPQRPDSALSGSAFYKQVDAMKWNEREPIARKEILAGNIPGFLKKFVPINVSATDSTGEKNTCTYFVAPDYLSIGSDDDFARVPLTPMTAQAIADSLHCFLPTRKNG